MKRKAKIEVTKNFIVEDFRNPPKKDVVAYRSKKLDSGHVIRFAILKREGPRGGNTVVTSIWHPKGERHSSSEQIKRFLERYKKR